jgi:serine/threonine protein kinase
MKIFVQVALAFQVIHKNDILHKQISPDHLLMSDSQGTKVTLTGFSDLRDLVKSDSIISTFTVKNSFLPPEVMQGAEYSKSADIWGLGVLLSTMGAGGRTPYVLHESGDVMIKAVSEEKQHFVGGFPEQFNSLVDRMM